MPMEGRVFLVEKNGSIHSVDYHHLDTLTRKDVYPLLNIEDPYDTMAGAHYFCCTNMASGCYSLAQLARHVTLWTNASIRRFREIDPCPKWGLMSTSSHEDLMADSMPWLTEDGSDTEGGWAGMTGGADGWPWQTVFLGIVECLITGFGIETEVTVRLGVRAEGLSIDAILDHVGWWWVWSCALTTDDLDEEDIAKQQLIWPVWLLVMAPIWWVIRG